MEQTKQANNEEQAPQACHHMEHSVQGLADGTLTGPMRWYTNWHVAVCPKCSAALSAARECHVHETDAAPGQSDSSA